MFSANGTLPRSTDRLPRAQVDSKYLRSLVSARPQLPNSRRALEPAGVVGYRDSRGEGVSVGLCLRPMLAVVSVHTPPIHLIGFWIDSKRLFFQATDWKQNKNNQFASSRAVSSSHKKTWIRPRGIDFEEERAFGLAMLVFSKENRTNAPTVVTNLKSPYVYFKITK